MMSRSLNVFDTKLWIIGGDAIDKDDFRIKHI